MHVDPSLPPEVHRVAEELVPEVDGPGLDALVTTRFDVLPAAHGAGDLVEIHDGGDRLAVADTAVGVASALHTRAHRRAFELAARRGWVRFHGVLADVDGRRVLAIGRSGAGKTTLALGLLVAGADVQADESVLVRGGVALAVPRRFHVKPGTEALLGTTPDWLATAPTLEAAPALRAVTPADLGRPWRTTAAPVDELVLLERTDGASHVEPAGGGDALGVLVDEAFRTVEPRAAVVREVAGLAARAPVHRLRAGPDGRAPSLVVDVATSRAH